MELTGLWWLPREACNEVDSVFWCQDDAASPVQHEIMHDRTYLKRYSVRSSGCVRARVPSLLCLRVLFNGRTG